MNIKMLKGFEGDFKNKCRWSHPSVNTETKTSLIAGNSLELNKLQRNL